MQQLSIKRRAILNGLGGVLGTAALSACGGSGGGGDGQQVMPWQVPLSIHDPYPVVTVRLQDRDTELLLDTGADGTVLDTGIARVLGLALSAETVPGSGGSGPSGEIRRAVVPRFAIGPALRQDVPVYVTDFPREFAWDGVLGADFLQTHAVRIDYAQGLLNAVEASSQLHAGRLIGSGPSIAMQRHASGKLLVQADLDGITGWFSVDTGAGQAVTVFRPAVERLGLRGRWGPGVRMTTGLTTGGLDRADCVRVPTLQLGGHRLKNPVVELSLATAGLFGSDAWLGNIGGEVLRRFGIGIDASRGVLALQPNASIDQPFAGPRAGFLWRDTGEALQVVEVLSDGPAAAAGLMVGDLLQQVDDQPIGPEKGRLLRAALRAPPGTEVRLLTTLGPRVLVLKELI
ncbi:MAG: hypothetical protein DI587_11000 [Variovorax paradoxus]|nr:MAG: hypothetical protein DI583_11000 [Variovorax paradoxus]PZQ10980.1 MAG: hypothetical protein DI587_11000 [Variovorax paradoxus]